jgi:3-oxoacyl-[acyl-carrier-protein] synthase II
MRRQVVITGIGLVTSLGSTREESWRRMVAGECGVRPVTLFDTEGYRARAAGEVDIDAVDAGLPALRLRRLSRGDRIGIRAAIEAVEDAGLTDSTVDGSRVGVFLGAGTGDLLRSEHFYQTWLESGIDRTRPSDVWNHFLSTPVDAIAERFGFEGPRGCIVAACSSSTIAIGRGVEAILCGRADVVLAGGTDALARLTFTGFNLLRLMDPDPCRPFDRSRAGMNIGEGAGVLVLEALDHARRRGARIDTELAGTPSPARRFIRRRLSPKAAPLRPSSPLRWHRERSTPTRWITSMRTARPRRRTMPPRRAASGASSATVPRICRSRPSNRWSATVSAPPAPSKRRCWP